MNPLEVRMADRGRGRRRRSCRSLREQADLRARPMPRPAEEAVTQRNEATAVQTVAELHVRLHRAPHGGQIAGGIGGWRLGRDHGLRAEAQPDRAWLDRSAERRGGVAGVSTCRSRWSPETEKKRYSCWDRDDSRSLHN